MILSDFDQEQKSHARRIEKNQFFWLTRNPVIIEKEKQLLEEILKGKPKKILEVGCGEGANLVSLHNMGFDGKITGVDHSPTKIAFAQKQAPYANLSVANAYKLPFKDNYFDLVFAKSVLHHIDNKVKVLKEMIRVCMKNGHLIIIEGNGRNFFNSIMARLLSHEKGMLNSTEENLLKLITAEKSISLEKILYREPVNLDRVILHYRFGIAELSCLKKFWQYFNKYLSYIVPLNQYAYFIFCAKKQTQINKIFSLKTFSEQGHFRKLYEEGRLNWWSTPAGKQRLERRSQIIARLVNRQDRILEIGCGIGEFSQLLSNIGNKITCIDISSEAINIARETIKTDNINFRLADIHALPFKDNSFDMVIGNSVLHHLELSKALEEIRRVLKKNGKIIFFEPNLVNPHVFLQKKVGFLKRISRDSPQETAFSRWGLYSTLEESGFIPIEIKPFDFLHPFTPKRLISVLKIVELFLEEIPLIKEISGSLMIVGQVNKPSLGEVKYFWDTHPLFSMEIKETLGSRNFFKKIDEVKKKEIDRYTYHLYQFSKYRGRKVLDAGCGPGFLTRNYAKNGAQVVALDISPMAIKITKRSLEYFNLKARVMNGNIERLPFPAKTFDLVVSTGVIHHTPNLHQAVSEINRVLKPTGSALIGVYYRGFFLHPVLFPVIKFMLRILKVMPPGRVRLISATTPADFIRQYDGQDNPLGVGFSKKRWTEIFNEYFRIEKIESHYFPFRFFFGQKKIPNFISRFFDHYFGTMLYFKLIKK